MPLEFPCLRDQFVCCVSRTQPTPRPLSPLLTSFAASACCQLSSRRPPLMEARGAVDCGGCFAAELRGPRRPRASDRQHGGESGDSESSDTARMTEVSYETENTELCTARRRSSPLCLTPSAAWITASPVIVTFVCPRVYNFPHHSKRRSPHPHFSPNAHHLSHLSFPSSLPPSVR